MGEMVVVSHEKILVRDDHPDFLKLVEEFLRWAESLPPDSDHPLKPSVWFLELLNNWVEEDRRIPVMKLMRPEEVGETNGQV